MVSLQPPILLPSSPFPSRSIPRLSPELIDTIIDYLHDDKSTLCRFALVSRRWVRSTRFHLFHHIRVLASDEHPGREFTPFVQFLCHNAHIGPFIRELEFCGSEARSDISLCDGFGILDDEQFLPILQRLPYLHTVILNQVSIIAPDSSRWTELVVPMLPPNTFHILDPIPVPRKLLPAFQLSPPDTLPLLRHLDALVVESRNDPMALGKIDGLMPFSMPDLNSLELTLELRLDIGDIEIKWTLQYSARNCSPSIFAFSPHGPPTSPFIGVTALELSPKPRPLSGGSRWAW